MNPGTTTSITRRLMVGLTVVIALTSVLVVALVAGIARRSEETALRAAITESTDRLARMLEVPLWDVDLDRAQRLAEAFASDPRVVQVTIRESVSGGMRVIARSATTDTVLRRQSVLHNGQPVGEIELSLDRHQYHAAIVRDVGVGLGVALFALVTSLIGMRLLLRNLLERPIADLSAVVSSYAAGDYSRVARTIGHGELRTFGEVLDTMGARIVAQLRDLREGNRNLGALNAVLGVASREVEPEVLLTRACEELCALLSLPYALAGVTDESGMGLVIRAEVMPPGERSLLGTTMPLRDPGVRTFLAATAPVLSENASADARLGFVRELLESRSVAGWCALPLTSDGIGFGAIALFSRERRRFTEQEVALASRIAGQVAVALARHRAHAAERLLRATIEQIPESVFVTDTDSRVVYVNPAFKTMFAVGDAALGRSPEDIVCADRADDPFADARAALALDRSWTGRIVLPRDGKRRLTCDVLISPVRDARGVATHHVGIMRDVSQEIEAEDRLRHSQKLEAVGQLAGGIAHDFNNVLSAIMLQLEYLETQTDDPAGQAQTIEDLRASVTRASKLPRQLLVFSRRQAMDIAPHDLNVVVGELLRMIRRLIGERITVTFTPSDEPLPFSGDSGMIEQVVVNLCVNARDAMERSGRLTLATHRATFNTDDVAAHPGGRAGSFARLSVSDTGVGMSPDVLAHAFEPFFTTKTSGKGTGLGLATTHGIVAQHKGWIEVQSAVDHGTTFDVYLPLSAAAPPAHAAPRRAVASGRARILLVEDEDVIRSIVARSLRGIGYDVVEASGPSDARRIWHSSRDGVDLMLTDMVMPDDVSGMELTSEFRRDKPGLRVVVMSGYNLDVMGEHDAHPLGVHFIKKPFDLASLSDLIRVALAA